MTTYIISWKEYSEKAMRIYGSGDVWRGHIRFRGRIPGDERSFHRWLTQMLRAKGVSHGTVRIIRPQARGESAGFKCIFYGHFDEHHVKVLRLHERSGDLHKAVPNIPWSQQPWFQRELYDLRPSGRFKGTARWPPKPRGERIGRS